MLEQLMEWDTELFLFLNGLHSPFWDTPMWYISAKLTWVPFYLVLAYLIFKQKGVKGIWAVVAVALLITLADQTSVHLFKNVFERLRPCREPIIEHLVHKVNNKCGGKFGFVSSHAANSFALGMFMSLFFAKRWATIGFIFWAALVSYSRVYLGVHYPGDILGGGILGCLLALGVFSVYRRTFKEGL